MTSKNILARLIAFSFFNDIGSSIFAFAINLYILQKTGSALAFSTGMVVIPLVNILFFPVSGYLIDNYNKKRVMVYSLLVAIISLILTLLLLSVAKTWLIIVLLGQLFVLRMCDILIQSSLLTLLPKLFEQEDLQQVNSLLQATMRFSSIFGPIIAGSLFYLIPFLSIGILEVVFDLISLFLILSIPQNSEYQENKTAMGQKIDLRNALSYIVSDRMIVNYLILCIFSNIVLASFQIGVPYLMLQKMNYSSIEYGVVESIFSVGALVGSLMLALTKVELKIAHSYLSFGIIGVGILGLGFGLALPHGLVSISTIFLASLVIGIGTMITNISMITLLQKEVSTDVQGHVFTAFDTLVTASLPIFALVFGSILQWNANLWIFYISGLLMLLTVVLIAKAWEKYNYGN